MRGSLWLYIGYLPQAEQENAGTEEETASGENQTEVW